MVLNLVLLVAGLLFCGYHVKLHLLQLLLLFELLCPLHPVSLFLDLFECLLVTLELFYLIFVGLSEVFPSFRFVVELFLKALDDVFLLLKSLSHQSSHFGICNCLLQHKFLVDTGVKLLIG